LPGAEPLHSQVESIVRSFLGELQRKRTAPEIPGPFSCASSSHQAESPTHGAAVAVGHDAVELARVGAEDERQEMAVAFPERQLENALDGHPDECALGVVGARLAVPGVD